MRISNTQHCWRQFTNHTRCQPVFPIPFLLFKYKNIGGALKLSNFISCYSRKKSKVFRFLQYTFTSKQHRHASEYRQLPIPVVLVTKEPRLECLRLWT
jgi:hypothetical protein